MLLYTIYRKCCRSNYLKLGTFSAAAIGRGSNSIFSRAAAMAAARDALPRTQVAQNRQCPNPNPNSDISPRPQWPRLIPQPPRWSAWGGRPRPRRNPGAMVAAPDPTAPQVVSLGGPPRPRHKPGATVAAPDPTIPQVAPPPHPAPRRGAAGGIPPRKGGTGPTIAPTEGG